MPRKGTVGGSLGPMVRGRSGPAPFNAASGGTEAVVYNYNGTSEIWKTHTFTGNGTLTVTSSTRPFKTLIAGNGGAGGPISSGRGGGGGGGGAVLQQDYTLALGNIGVTVGSPSSITGYGSANGGSNGGPGDTSSGGARNGGSSGNGNLGGLNRSDSWQGGGGGGAGGAAPNGGPPGVGVSSTIRGTTETFGAGGTGGDQANGGAGQAGVVIFAYQVGPSTGFNDAVGGTVTTVSNYNGTGQTWRVHTFTSSGTLSVISANQPFTTLVIGGGGAGGNGQSVWNGGGGGGGGATTFSTNTTLSVGNISVVVGGGGALSTVGNGEGQWGNPGGQSSLGSITAAGGGGGVGGVGGNAGSGPLSGGTNYAITGSTVLYGQNGGSGGTNPNYGPQSPTLGGGGGGSVVGSGGPYWTGGSNGQNGAVIVAYRIG